MVYLAAGIVLVVLAIGLSFWFAVRKRKNSDDTPWNNGSGQ
jgi:LPXTG-motif cell wall-anchored protein